MPRSLPWFRCLMVLCVFLVLLPLACTAQALESGDYEYEIKNQDRARSYLLHLPPQADQGKPLPVVLSFHGGGAKASSHRTYTGMDRKADAVGFIAVYPNGSGRWGKRLLSWNAGKCCAYAQKKNIDDVGFVRALIEDIAAKTPVDRQRIYATGLSNGAMMTYRLAVEASDIIAAIAPVAGAMQVESFAPQGVVPVLHIHSKDDPRALYDGGLGPRFPFTTKRVNHESVERSIKHWAVFNECANVAKPKRDRRGALGTKNEGQSATLYVYESCYQGKEVALWQLSGVGHGWPGGKLKDPDDLLGPPTTVIDANDEVWAFFSRFSLGDGS